VFCMTDTREPQTLLIAVAKNTTHIKKSIA
jgi:hypothetical protein